MKRHLVILLLVAYTSSVFNLQELIKLPTLIKHYQYHLNLNSQLGITEFLYTHYIACPQNVDDFADDMKLPFKSNDQKAVNGDQYIQSPLLTIQVLPIYHVCPVLETPIYKSKFIARYQAFIWQPPKLV